MPFSRAVRSRVLVAIVVAGWFASASRAAAQEDLALTLRVEAPGQPAAEMKVSVGDSRLRMDMSQAASMIWTNQSMLMIQHDKKSYIEFGPEQLKLMQQMLGRLPQRGGEAGAGLDPTRVRFRETGRREMIGVWEAFEVEMTGLAEGQTGALWMTEDLEIGMLDVMARVGDSLQSMPMFGNGTGPGQELARYRQLVAAAGLPEGQVVRIVGSDKGRTTTMTLVDVEPGPLPADTFAAPAGYSKMEMPAIPGR
jgi:hypothetical protein